RWPGHQVIGGVVRFLSSGVKTTFLFFSLPVFDNFLLSWLRFLQDVGTFQTLTAMRRSVPIINTRLLPEEV
ncbi:hypothetical protein BDZ97DRAFT_1884934, partial [Flammula alnicola]